MGIFGINTSIVGLDIGAHSIKLVEVKHGKKVPVITYAQSMPIPRAGTDEPASEEAVGEALRELIRQSKMRGKRVVTAVPSALDAQVTMRSIFISDLPVDAPKSVLQMSVRAEFEAQDYIAYDEAAEIDCHVEGEVARDGNRGLDVFVVAVHRDLIAERVQLLRSCGLVPIAIDVDFLALARLIIVTGQLSETDNVAILDIGSTKTSVGFYQQGKLHLYPHVPIAGNHLTSQLALHLNVNWEEAEAYKHTRGWETASDASNPERTAAWGVLEDSLDRGLYQQLYGHFDAYIREFTEFKPSRVIVSGGTAQLPPLKDFLSSWLTIPVEVLHYFDQLSVDAKGEVAALEGNEPLFSTAVGLALKRV